MKSGEIEELSKRTILLLEKTKKDYKKFEKERKQLFCYLVNKNNPVEWKKYMEQLEEIINENK